MKDFVVKKKSIELNIENGTLYAHIIEDSNYPGIRIDFIPKDDQSEISLSVLVEKPHDDSLRMVIWNNNDDDYSEIFKFQQNN